MTGAPAYTRGDCVPRQGEEARKPVGLFQGMVGAVRSAIIGRSVDAEGQPPQLTDHPSQTGSDDVRPRHHPQHQLLDDLD
jgi:hypothetical protein